MARRIAVTLALVSALLFATRLLLPRPGPVATAAAERLSPEAAARHVGEHAEVCGTVASAKHATRSRSQPTFLNLGRAYPDHVFTALVWGKNRHKFAYAPESLEGVYVCVRGVISLFEEKPQIIVSSPSQLTLPPKPAETLQSL